MSLKSTASLCFLALSLLWSCQEPEKFVTEKPDETRFTKITLIEKLDEPMEIEVLADGRIIFIERKGKIRMFEPSSGSAKDIGFIDVFYESEDGLLGLAKDPGFEKNQWIYLYYSPVGDNHINRLSRFTLLNDMVDMESEKIMLEIPQFRGCCHSGGSIEFDSQGNLYLSLGDDTTPFESDNYNPIDERPGRPKNVDAQRSSSNTNDLRGAILRISPQDDGSYTIPKGNLFPEGTPNTRPEIYVMGNRNPFRISIDQMNGNLYWGEVGPDAHVDSLQRGPRGYDEINQAKEAGFFGWPYLIADNKPYWHYDFEKQESNYEYDPAKPVNHSPNNTGLTELPPAQPAFIWYPYADSEEFPELRDGGRNAMAGPVYYPDLFPKSEVKFPRYYEGKLFIYDWMRSWIFTVTMDENHDFVSMEEFMPSTVFNKPMDMQFGLDGSLYVLEYGTYWSAQNDDSGIYRIEFNAGNRKPVAKANANKTQGAAPMEVMFSGSESYDFDENDSLAYEWDFYGNGTAISKEKNPIFNYDKPGIYKAVLTVRDTEGLESTSEIEIKVGNEPPVISVDWEGNRSFYWGNPIRSYSVKVNDKEDGSIGQGIDADDVQIAFNYLAEGFDRIESGMGHQQENPLQVIGMNLTAKSGCNACHAVDNASVGPSYTEISEKYANQSDAKPYLLQKVTNGGSGVWGERLMPGHGHLEENTISQMVDYIISLSPENRPANGQNLPIEGDVKFDKHRSGDNQGTYLFTVSYRDNGANGIDPIFRRKQLVLRSPQMAAADANEFKGAAKANYQDSRLVKFTEDHSFIKFESIDL
ncbi:MAG: PKD domain-containing protein, partial [Mongoliibacter sp.]|uniref:PQQ-dependent sugar dehydrogenase n=1 Tax=Mongoliibacter sp. TaxID=2022438 RepID=UPI0012EEE80B